MTIPVTGAPPWVGHDTVTGRAPGVGKERREVSGALTGWRRLRLSWLEDAEERGWLSELKQLHIDRNKEACEVITVQKEVR